MEGFPFVKLALSFAVLLVIQLWVLAQVRDLVSAVKRRAAPPKPRGWRLRWTKESKELEEAVASNPFHEANLRLPMTLSGALNKGGQNHVIHLDDVSLSAAIIRFEKKIAMPLDQSYPIYFYMPGGELIETKFHITEVLKKDEYFKGFFVNLRLEGKSVLRKYLHQGTGDR